MSNVTPLPKPKVDPDIIRELEKALERAHAGELTGLLMVYQTEQPQMLNYMIVGIRDRFTKIGFLSHAMHKLQSDP